MAFRDSKCQNVRISLINYWVTSCGISDPIFKKNEKLRKFAASKFCFIGIFPLIFARVILGFSINLQNTELSLHEYFYADTSRDFAGKLFQVSTVSFRKRTIRKGEMC